MTTDYNLYTNKALRTHNIINPPPFLADALYLQPFSLNTWLLGA